MGPGCAWGLGLCLLWEAGGSSASPVHTDCSVLGPERGNGWGAALRGPEGPELGAWRLEHAGSWGLCMPDWESSKGPVICSCSCYCLHLVGKSFLGKRDRLKRNQGEALRTGGASCSAPLLLCAQTPPLQA